MILPPNTACLTGRPYQANVNIHVLLRTKRRPDCLVETVYPLSKLLLWLRVIPVHWCVSFSSSMGLPRHWETTGCMTVIPDFHQPRGTGRVTHKVLLRLLIKEEEAHAITGFSDTFLVTRKTTFHQSRFSNTRCVEVRALMHTQQPRRRIVLILYELSWFLADI